MPSPEVERILDEYRKSPGTLLKLPSGLSSDDFANLTAAADVFSAVDELYVRSGNADWLSNNFVPFAIRLNKLSKLNLLNSSNLSDTDLLIISGRLTTLTRLSDCPICLKIAVLSRYHPRYSRLFRTYGTVT